MSIENNSILIPLPSEDVTLRLGRFLSRLFGKGDTVALSGPLGAGKTTLVRGMLSGLGADPSSASPTFNILHVYGTIPPLYHFDAYRFKRPEEFLDIGGEEYFDGTGIVVIEWAEKMRPFLPARVEMIELAYADPGRRALITLSEQKQSDTAPELLDELHGFN